jgi:hypothetical protein
VRRPATSRRGCAARSSSRPQPTSAGGTSSARCRASASRRSGSS